jgi:hypothetical protein
VVDEKIVKYQHLDTAVVQQFFGSITFSVG